MSCGLYIVPYEILSVKLWAVQNTEGVIFKYCETREDAQGYLNRAESGDYSWIN